MLMSVYVVKRWSDGMLDSLKDWGNRQLINMSWPGRSLFKIESQVHRISEELRYAKLLNPSDDVLGLKAKLQQAIKAGWYLDSGTTWQNPLHIMLDLDMHDMAIALIQAGADISVRNIMEHTPLHRAVQKGDIVLAKELIKAGAELDCEATYGRNAVSFALERRDLAMMKLLIEAGASTQEPVCAESYLTNNITIYLYEPKNDAKDFLKCHQHIKQIQLARQKWALEQSSVELPSDLYFHIFEEVKRQAILDAPFNLSEELKKEVVQQYISPYEPTSEEEVDDSFKAVAKLATGKFFRENLLQDPVANPLEANLCYKSILRAFKNVASEWKMPTTLNLQQRSHLVEALSSPNQSLKQSELKNIITATLSSL